VGNRSEFPQLQIPPVIIRIEARLLDPFVKGIMVILTLAPSYDLADLGHQDIHCPNCLFILVHLHIKGLDLFWIVYQYYGAFEDLFTEITLMFRLQIDTPFHREFKFLPCLLENLDPFCVSEDLKIMRDQGLKSFDQCGVNETVKKFHVLLTVSQNRGKYLF